MPDAGERRAVRIRSAVRNGGQPAQHVGAASGPQRVALLQQGGEFGGECPLRRGAGRQHHRSEPGVAAELRHLPAGRSDAPGFIQGAELRQQSAGGGQRPWWWRVGEGQAAGRGAPGGAIEHQAGQLRLQDFGPVERRQPAMQGRSPQPYCDARRLPARAARALVGRRPADAQGLQPGQPGAGVEHR